MKIRQGFVSNSSSSSFVVIGTGDFITPKFYGDDFTIGEDGHAEFGWEVGRYDDVHDRINFAWLLAEYQENDGWKEMINTLIKKHFKCGEVHVRLINEYNYDSEDSNHENLRYGYIDHQSAASESDNGDIFDSIEILERFLFCKDSYIQGDNDNHIKGE